MSVPVGRWRVFSLLVGSLGFVFAVVLICGLSVCGLVVLVVWVWLFDFGLDGWFWFG